VRRLILGVLAAIVVPVLLVACGDDDESTPDDGNGPISIATLQPLSENAPEIDAEFATLDGGLQIATITDGQGAQPRPGDLVTVNYSGWLLDGALFDSSLRNGQPFSFILGQGRVIRGWDQGVAEMEVGGVYRLIIPPELGYGSAGAGATIPPDSTLVFDISVISSDPVQATPAPTPFATVNSTPPPVNVEPVTTQSGLQIFTISEGLGETPVPGSTVTLDYAGWVEGGGEFDRGTGFSFPVSTGRVIPGFDEGVALMKKSGTYRLVIPPGLAYGAQGAPPRIGPNATLIFDISITSITPP
jgi:FKBP-type peptidyl-prolyl cis-trans isomerase